MAVNDGDVEINITGDASELIGELKNSTAAVSNLRSGLDQLNATMRSNVGATTASAATFARGARGAEDFAQGVEKAHLNVSLLTRELLVMGREIAQGRFTRLAGSATITAQAMGAASGTILAAAGVMAFFGGAIAGAAYEMEQGAQDALKLSNALKATGYAAGESSDQIIAMSQRMAAQLNASAAAVRELALQAVRSGKVGGDGLELMTADAAKLAEALGEKPQQAMKTLLALTGDIAKKSAELNEQLHFLTASQWLEIQAMEQNGDKAGALSAALEALKTHLADVNNQATGLDWVFQQLKQHTDAVIESIRGLGRVQGPAEQLAKLQELLNNPGEQAAIVAQGGSVDTGAIKERIASLQRELGVQQELAGWVVKNGQQQQQHIADLQAYGKKNTELDDALAAKKRLTDDLAASRAKLASASSAAAKAEAQLLVTKDTEALGGANRRIDQLNKQIAGPKGPHVDLFSEYRDQWAQQAATLTENDKASKADLLRAEVKFWADKEAVTGQGTAKSKNLRLHEDEARLAAQKQLDAALKAEADKHAKAMDELGRAKAQGQRQVAEDQATFVRDQQTGEIDAEITALKDKMAAEGKYPVESIAKLKAFYADKGAILKAAAQAEYQAKIDAANDDKSDAAGDSSLSDDQRAVRMQKDDNAILIARQALANATLKIDLDTAKSQATVTDEVTARQVKAYRQAATGIADSFRTTLEGLIEHTTTWQQVWLSTQRKVLDGFLRMGEQMVLANVMKNQQLVLADRFAANEKGQIDFKAGLAAIRNDAAQAFSGAFKATVGIPIVGPILAPVAGATAFAATVAMESGITAFSAAGGMGSVPYDNAPFLLHKNEMVLPAALANPMREMLLGGIAQSSTSNTTNNGGDTNHTWKVAAPANTDPRSVADAIKMAFRQGHLKREMFA